MKIRLTALLILSIYGKTPNNYRYWWRDPSVRHLLKSELLKMINEWLRAVKNNPGFTPAFYDP